MTPSTMTPFTTILFTVIQDITEAITVGISVHIIIPITVRIITHRGMADTVTATRIITAL